MNEGGDVLVVEDDPDVADVLLQVLGLAGYACRCAANGLEALEAAAEQLPALVLLDMLMPVMDGWQCGRELRARYGDSLAIVVTTAAEHARRCGDDIGADDVLAKPFDIGDLLTIVDRYACRPPAGRNGLTGRTS